MGEALAPYLPQITTLMLSSLRSTEGIVVSREEVGWAVWKPWRGIYSPVTAEPESALCLRCPASVRGQQFLPSV